MALDTEMMNSRGEMSPMMRVASIDDDAKMQAILDALRKAMGPMLSPQGYGASGAPMLPTPGGQHFAPMDNSPAPPGYRLNQAPPMDPRLMQALAMRQPRG